MLILLIICTLYLHKFFWYSFKSIFPTEASKLAPEITPGNCCELLRMKSIPRINNIGKHFFAIYLEGWKTYNICTLFSQNLKQNVIYMGWMQRVLVSMVNSVKSNISPLWISTIIESISTIIPQMWTQVWYTCTLLVHILRDINNMLFLSLIYLTQLLNYWVLHIYHLLEEGVGRRGTVILGSWGEDRYWSLGPGEYMLERGQGVALWWNTSNQHMRYAGMRHLYIEIEINNKIK